MVLMNSAASSKARSLAWATTGSCSFPLTANPWSVPGYCSTYPLKSNRITLYARSFRTNTLLTCSLISDAKNKSLSAKINITGVLRASKSAGIFTCPGWQETTKSTLLWADICNTVVPPQQNPTRTTFSILSSCLLMASITCSIIYDISEQLNAKPWHIWSQDSYIQTVA